MAEKKITKREVINMMMNEEFVKANETYMAYLQNELTLLDNRKENNKATATQKENEGTKEVIVAVLSKLGKGTVTDIQNASEELKALSNQKISALLRQLKESGEVDKTTDKKKSYFFLVGQSSKVGGWNLTPDEKTS